MEIRRTIARESLLVAALLAALWAADAVGEESQEPPDLTATAIEVRYRGCDAAGWCLFEMEPGQPWAGSLLRVRPVGVTRAPRGEAALELRDRLNALLASMIHQSKRIVLRGLRPLDDGSFAAAVTVNDIDLALDPVLLKIGGTAAPTGQARICAN